MDARPVATEPTAGRDPAVTACDPATLRLETRSCSIVYPVYYNELNLRETLAELKRDVISKNPETKWEVVFVDDGSGDGSFGVCQELRRENPGLVRLVKLTRNFGQASALYAGFSEAKGDIVVMLSADGQDPAALIHEMLRIHREEQRHIVIATRTSRSESFYRSMTSRIFYWLMRRLTFSNMPPGGFDFVSMSRRVVELLLRNAEAHPFLQGQILWTGYDPKFIPYHRRERKAGRSRWTFDKKVSYLYDGVLSYSFLPLRIISTGGFVVAMIGFLYALLIIGTKIFVGIPVQGWAPIMVVVLLLGGIQLLVVGVVGEYLWCVLAQVRRRAPYVIESVDE